MREIKFRAWDKSADRYIYSYEPYDQPKREYILVEFGIGFSNYKKDDLIIEQYTGLKDTNGIEIYEGDIVIHEFSTDPSVVYFDDCLLMFAIERKKLFGTETIGLYRLKEAIEVIGNIHENKELLK